MEFRNMNTFIKVAELHSFSRAAEAIGYSQSTVTTQIKRLEAELQVRLFDRIGNNISLTEQGKQYLKYANQIMHLVEEARKETTCDNEVRGHLSIALTESLCSSFFPDILERFHKCYPNVQLECLETRLKEMYTMLNHNEVDLAFTLDQKIYRPDIIRVMEQPEKIYFVASIDHPLAGMSQVSLQELLKQEFILTEQGMSYRDQLDQFLLARNIHLQPYLELGNTQTICRMVSRNLGISFLPLYAVADEIESGAVSILHVPDTPFILWKQLFYRKDKWLTSPMQAMIDLLVCKIDAANPQGDGN